MMDPLDNPVWHALTGPQAKVAEGTARARRYDPAFSVFAALADEPDAAAWDDLAALVGPGETALLVPDRRPPTGWTVLGTVAVHQMVGRGAPAPEPPRGFVELTAADHADMRTLVTATEPGPWCTRTAELGAFVGIRDHGRLVAMAGQRMQLEGACEVSAVCTDPEHRGRGLASALTMILAARIRASGRTPLLHVMVENTSAVRAYERAGFAVRATLRPGAYQAPA